MERLLMRKAIAILLLLLITVSLQAEWKVQRWEDPDAFESGISTWWLVRHKDKDGEWIEHARYNTVDAADRAARKMNKMKLSPYWRNGRGWEERERIVESISKSALRDEQ